MQDLWRRMDDWSRRVQASLSREGSDEERAAVFVRSVVDDLERATSRAEAEAYARALHASCELNHRLILSIWANTSPSFFISSP